MLVAAAALLLIHRFAGHRVVGEWECWNRQGMRLSFHRDGTCRVQGEKGVWVAVDRRIVRLEKKSFPRISEFELDDNDKDGAGWRKPDRRDRFFRVAE